MPSNDFEVKNYEVQIQPTIDFNPYDIHLSGPRMAHGIQHSAMLNFSESPDDEGYVSNVGAQNFDGHRVSARLDVEFFDHMYELLRTEKPVNFQYRYESDSDTYRDLYGVQLTTSEEPLGEGLRDESP